jgi:hypothetical protein
MISDYESRGYGMRGISLPSRTLPDAGVACPETPVRARTASYRTMRDALEEMYSVVALT